jgi:hypothetical protein
MASFTLADNKNLGLDDLQAGIAETIVTVAPGLGLIPFNTVAGNAYAFNREKTLVDGQLIAADGTITDSSEMTTDLIQIALKGISGQADIANLQLHQQIGANAGNNTLSLLVASAAKGVARKYQDMLINGTTGANGWDGLAAIMASTAFANQVEDAANAAFSFDLLDNALARNGVRPQWIMGNAKAENAFKKLLRAAGGVTMTELNGVQFVSYENIPFIRNDYIAADNVGGTAGNQTNIYTGTWDDGTASGGLAGLTTAGSMFRVDQFDKLEGKDATRVRVVMYGAAAAFSPVQMSVLKNVTV